ncbi:MAG: DNA repair protein RecN [Pseudomonadota bacterium]
MIQKLHIQGMAIIEELKIDFSDGFNVITGETGAGKSILIRALSFLLGHKVGPDMIRQGFETATVTGEFFLRADHEALTYLESVGVPFEKNKEGAPIIVRRQVNAKGRASAWVNDIPVVGSTVKELGLHLVDIFGQHDNQKLMRSEFHLSYLDKFLENKNLAGLYREEYRQCISKVRDIEETLNHFLSGRKDLDYHLFRLQELEAFGPSIEDFQAVKELTETSRASVALKEGLGQVLASLENEGQSLNSVLWDSVKKIGRLNEKISSKDLDSLRERAESLASEMDTLSYDVSRMLGSLEVDESKIEEAHKRVYGYQELFRKHGVREAEDLIQIQDKLKRDCLSQDDLAVDLKKELEKLVEQAEKLSQQAKKLSQQRLKAAHRIKKAVESELSELAMPGVVFDVLWEETEGKERSLDCSSLENKCLTDISQKLSELLKNLGPDGYEHAEFMLASNPGEPLLPLLRVASGGELSRIMLALKKALVADADTCVLVFDEIDTGISGRVADVVGKKMKGLAEAFQVLCISHLPQVAVYADTHFLVKKEARPKAAQSKTVRTESTIVRLSKTESTAEIARLLSGSEVSKAGLANAKALLEKAKKLSTKSELNL